MVKPELEWPQDWDPQRDLERIYSLLEEIRAKVREVDGDEYLQAADTLLRHANQEIRLKLKGP